MHIRSDPSFFLTKRIGAPKGALLATMNPASCSFVNCDFNSSSMGADIVRGAWNGVDAPGCNSIVMSYSRCGGRLDGSLNTSAYSFAIHDACVENVVVAVLLVDISSAC